MLTNELAGSSFTAVQQYHYPSVNTFCATLKAELDCNAPAKKEPRFGHSTDRKHKKTHLTNSQCVHYTVTAETPEMSLFYNFFSVIEGPPLKPLRVHVCVICGVKAHRKKGCNCKIEINILTSEK